MLSLVLFSLLVTEAPVVPAPDTRDPRLVMEAFAKRDLGDRALGTMNMIITGKNGRKRERSLRFRQLEASDHRKQIMHIVSPTSMRNTGFLSLDYEDGKKDDAQWLYLAGMHKTTRIATAEQSGSFLGSDLSYSDLTRMDTNLYEFELLSDEVVVDGEPCWLILARATDAREAKKTGYLKSQLWISKKSLVAMQIKAWITKGKKLKYSKAHQVELIDGVWVTRRLVVRTVRGKEVLSTTEFRMDEVAFDREEVQEVDFTKQVLERGI